MQHDAREMVPPRAQTEELAVEHVRNPGQRMPVGGVTRSQSPAHALARQARLDVRVVEHVGRVIVVHKPIARRGPEDREHRQRQEQADQ